MGGPTFHKFVCKVLRNITFLKDKEIRMKQEEMKKTNVSLP